MYLKGSLSILFALMIIFNTSHAMELMKSTIQENAVPATLMLGIGAAGSAIQAAILNKINAHHNIDYHYSISKSAGLGVLGASAILATSIFTGYSNKYDIYSAQALYELMVVVSLTCIQNQEIRKMITNKNTLIHNYGGTTIHQTRYDNQLSEDILDSTKTNHSLVIYLSRGVGPLMLSATIIGLKYLEKVSTSNT